jgi:hypothetical protein
MLPSITARLRPILSAALFASFSAAAAASPSPSPAPVNLNPERHVTPPAMTLHTGADCTRVLGSSPRSARQNPAGGPATSTLISVPLEGGTSGHLAAGVRNSTARAQFSEACAKK